MICLTTSAGADVKSLAVNLRFLDFAMVNLERES